MYKFNQHHICINPTKAFFYSSKKLSAEIRVASVDGNWYYGLSTDYGNGGVGWGVSSIRDLKYPSHELALANGIVKLTEILMKWVVSKNLDNSEAQKAITEMQALIKPRVEQLQLF